MKRTLRFGPGNVALYRLVISLTAIALLVSTPPAFGAGADGDDGAEEQARPVIGLVLSGGGARGLAHVGVIRWFEEHRIPIDLVAGTSMGGLVGGIYATGADSEAMVDLIETIDWQLVLGADTPYPQKAFRRKEDALVAPTPLEIGLRDGIKLPEGLDAGHQVGLVLDRIAFPYAGLDSFDQLPTPFASVAVDLTSGEEVVYRSGRFAEALRSTMSFPGWFAPVRSGDRVLVDGGVLNNLPTDVMIEMGAEVIIAVDLGMRSAEQEPFDNVLGVLNRTLTVMMRANTDRNAALADLLITPDVSAYGFADFDEIEALGRIGYEATEELTDEIGVFALNEADWQAYQRARADKRRSFEATPEFLEIEGAVETDLPTVEATLERHLGVPLEPDLLDYDLTNITGWGRYNVAGYRGRQQNGSEGLGIGLQEKTHGPPFVRPIFSLSGSEFREALLTFGARLIVFDAAGTNSEWRLDATYGQTTQVATDLFVPLGSGGFFVDPRAIARRETLFEYAEGEKVAELELDRLGGGGDIGYLFGPRSELRFGVNVEHQRAKIKVGDPLIPNREGMAGNLGGRWSFDGADRAIVSTNGVRFTVAARWYFATPEVAEVQPLEESAPDESFSQARFELTSARPLTERFFLVTALAGGTSFDATASSLQQFRLGGPLQLGALGVGERRGNHFYYGRAGVLWGLTDEDSPSLLGKFYLAAAYEIGDAFEEESDPFQDITFGLVGTTPVGGVFVGGAVGEDGQGGFFFTIGRVF